MQTRKQTNWHRGGPVQHDYGSYEDKQTMKKRPKHVDSDRSQKRIASGIKPFSSDSKDQDDDLADGFVRYVMEPPSVRSN